MKALRIALIVFMLGLISLGVAAAMSFRGNIPVFEPLDEAIADFGLVSQLRYTSDGDAVPLPSAQELIDSADAIFQVTPTGNREQHKGAVLSEVTVEAVIRDTRGIALGDSLLIYEPVMVNPFVMPGAICQYIVFQGPANIMQVGRSYIACLRFYEKPVGYRYADDELRTYLFSVYPCGVFPVVEPDCYAYVTAEINKDATYAEIQKNDCVADSDAAFEEYLSLREQVVGLLGLR